LVSELQLFSFSWRGWGTRFVNNLDTEFTYSIKQFGDTDYKSYVVRLPPNTDNTIIYWLNNAITFPPYKEMQSLNKFNDLIEDIIVYDFHGNVIMTIDDIRNSLSTDDYVEEIEITGELAIDGREKYDDLPKFTGQVLNWPDSMFFINNQTNNRIFYIKYNNHPLSASSGELGAGDNSLFCFFLHPVYENIDGMIHFNKITADINVYTPNGETILTLDDFTADRFTITRDGSEKYGNRRYTITVTEEDIEIAKEKYADVNPVDIKQEMERVKEIIDRFFKGEPGILE
jgi:hypothetical protein